MSKINQNTTILYVIAGLLIISVIIYIFTTIKNSNSVENYITEAKRILADLMASGNALEAIASDYVSVRKSAEDTMQGFIVNTTSILSTLTQLQTNSSNAYNSIQTNFNNSTIITKSSNDTVILSNAAIAFITAISSSSTNISGSANGKVLGNTITDIQTQQQTVLNTYNTSTANLDIIQKAYTDGLSNEQKISDNLSKGINQLNIFTTYMNNLNNLATSSAEYKAVDVAITKATNMISVLSGIISGLSSSDTNITILTNLKNSLSSAITSAKSIQQAITSVFQQVVSSANSTLNNKISELQNYFLTAYSIVGVLSQTTLSPIPYSSAPTPTLSPGKFSLLYYNNSISGVMNNLTVLYNMVIYNYNQIIQNLNKVYSLTNTNQNAISDAISNANTALSNAVNIINNKFPGITTPNLATFTVSTIPPQTTMSLKSQQYNIFPSNGVKINNGETLFFVSFNTTSSFRLDFIEYSIFNSNTNVNPIYAIASNGGSDSTWGSTMFNNVYNIKSATSPIYYLPIYLSADNSSSVSSYISSLSSTSNVISTFINGDNGDGAFIFCKAVNNAGNFAYNLVFTQWLGNITIPTFNSFVAYNTGNINVSFGTQNGNTIPLNMTAPLGYNLKFLRFDIALNNILINNISSSTPGNITIPNNSIALLLVRWFNGYILSMVSYQPSIVSNRPNILAQITSYGDNKISLSSLASSSVAISTTITTPFNVYYSLFCMPCNTQTPQTTAPVVITTPKPIII